MIRLQDDIIEIYNLLTDFSSNTLSGLPIKVEYSESLNSLCFEQKGLKVAISVLNYYCENLKYLKETYLLPGDYDFLMSSLSLLTTKTISVIPLSINSSTIKSKVGLSTMFSISFGTPFVIGKNLVPLPAQGITANFTSFFIISPINKRDETSSFFIIFQRYDTPLERLRNHQAHPLNH